MIGAIVGDIVGSVYEFNNLKSKDIEFFRKDSFFTDDTVMTIAVGLAIADHLKDGGDLGCHAVSYMQGLGRRIKNVGYGPMFRNWIRSTDPKQYGSFGNGSAMRCSVCGRLRKTLPECLEICDAVTSVTHNHPEGIKGARAVTEAIWLASRGCTKDEIRQAIETTYGYDLGFTLDAIRPTYKFYVSCQGSVPQAIVAFLESDGFEDSIRNAISIGGDSDTIAAITGSISEAFYGCPEKFNDIALSKFTDELLCHYRRIIDEMPYVDNVTPVG